MSAERNTYIKSAYEQLQMISQDREKRLEYEARLKATLDYNQGMFEAEQRGEQRGIQRGELRGTERVNKLNLLLLQHKRYDDLERSAKDVKFQQQLMSEYRI